MRHGDIELGGELVRTGIAESAHVADITADAFRADPVNLWLFRSFSGISALWHLQARRIYGPRGYCYRLGDEGACMWALPDDDVKLGALDTLAFAWTILRSSGPGAVSRALAIGGAMDRHHPQYPHVYLFSIGLRPRSQGRGLGRKLIAPVLEACDRAGLPAYLENSNPRNTGFYRSCGFEPQEEFRARPGAPPLLAMLRQPRAG